MNMTQEYLHAKTPGIHNFIVKDSPIRFMQVNYQEVEERGLAWSGVPRSLKPAYALPLHVHYSALYTIASPRNPQTIHLKSVYIMP